MKRNLSVTSFLALSMMLGCSAHTADRTAAKPPDSSDEETPREPWSNPQSPGIAYINGLWLEKTAEKSRFVRGDRYSVNGVFTAKSPATIDRQIDLGGAYAIPPFGEAHNHNVDGLWTAAMADRYLQQGIFYYKNPNDVGPITALSAGMFNQPQALDVRFAHGGLSIDEGHPEKLYRNLAQVYRLDPEHLDGVAFFALPTVAEFERRWPEIQAGRPDFLKLYLLNAKREGNGVSEGLAPDVFRRAVELARTAGLRTTVHVETAADLALAVDAGADESAHLPGRKWRYDLGPDAYRISDDLARRMAARDFVVVTTTLVTEAKFADDPAKTKIQALQVENLQRLHAAGVPLAIGTDVYQQTALDEVRHLHSLWPIAAAELLELWIETAPRSIFPDRAIGRLTPGYEASFLVLECDPTAEFTCVERIELRVKQGVVLGD